MTHFVPLCVLCSPNSNSCSLQSKEAEDRLGAFRAQIRWPPTHRRGYGRVSSASSFEMCLPRRKKPTRVAAGMRIQGSDDERFLFYAVDQTLSSKLVMGDVPSKSKKKQS